MTKLATKREAIYCSDCGMLTSDAGEFHPQIFCAMKRGGIADPWAAFASLVERVYGIEAPKQAPLIRTLPLAARLYGEGK